MIDNKIRFLFKNQFWHIGGLVLLFYIGFRIINLEESSGLMLGLKVKHWFILSMITPLIHQVYYV